MTFGDIAAALNLHESTVSRAVRDKYIGTPFHTVKLKELFTTGLGAAGTKECISSKPVKEEIRRLIEHEDKSQPLSDQDLCNQLKNFKIEISRRTVAKYREEMEIWSSGKRKVYYSFRV
jgi:RNA polymerase sigma-54 factor